MLGADSEAQSGRLLLALLIIALVGKKHRCKSDTTCNSWSMSLFKEVMKIDFEKDLIIGCIPVEHMSSAPTDQSPCIIEGCQLCKALIWVSEKKIELRKNKKAKIFCFICLVDEVIKQGKNPKDILLRDIGKKTH